MKLLNLLCEKPKLHLNCAVSALIIKLYSNNNFEVIVIYLIVVVLPMLFSLIFADV